MNSDLLWSVTDVLAKVTVVLLAGGLFAAAMGGAAAARRHFIWALSGVAALVMPLLCAALPAWRVLPAKVGHSAVMRSDASVNGEPFARALPSSTRDTIAVSLSNSKIASKETSAQSLRVDSAGSSSGNLHARQTQPIPIAPIADAAVPKSPQLKLTPAQGLLLIWSAGSVLLLTRLILSWAVLRRLWARATPINSSPLTDMLSTARADLNLHLHIGLRTRGKHAMPMTWGIIKPVILLPAAASEWPTSRARLALLHELAHIKRRDSLAQLIGQLCCALYWFHPLAWLAAAGLRREQERAADDRVLSLDSHDTDYASFLLELATRPGQGWFGGNAATAMARPSAMEGRLRAILDVGRRKDSLSTQGAWVAVVVALALVLPVAAIRGQVQAPQPATVPTSQAAAAGEHYTGHVVSPDGKPVGGADVLLLGYSKTKIGIVQQLATYRTDTDGAFVLPAIPADDLVPGPSIHAWAPGYAVGFSRPGKDIVLRLTLPSSIQVTFLDPGGRPVPGLHLRPTLMPGIALAEAFSSRFARTTDANGACVFDMLPRLSRTHFTVDDERFARLPRAEDVQVGAGAQSGPVTIHLAPAGGITGKVTYGPTGAPAPGIRVVAEKRGSGGDWFGVNEEILTNDRGEYHISQVGEGDYKVRLSPFRLEDTGWASVNLYGVHVPTGRVIADQNFVLVKGAIVHGRVYEAETRKPVPNALVSSVDLHTVDYLARAKTDAAGNFVMRVPPGRQGIYLVTPPPDGFSSAEFDGRTHPRSADNTRVENSNFRHYYEINALDGQDISVGLRLVPKVGEPVSGRVVDADGKPVAGIDVRATETEKNEIVGFDSYVSTDAEGRFLFRALLPGAELSVLRGNVGTLKPVVLKGGDENVVLQLAKNIKTSVTGTVVDAAGKPIADAAIMVTVIGGPMIFTRSELATLTNLSGQFTLPDLPTRLRYSIKVNAAGYVSKGVDLKFTPDDEHFDAGKIVMETLPSGK